MSINEFQIIFMHNLNINFKPQNIQKTQKFKILKKFQNSIKSIKITKK
jgi:hypothetical protein